MKKFFLKDKYKFSINNHLNLVSDQVASTEHALLKYSKIVWLEESCNCSIQWISVKRLTLWIIIFYRPNSNDMAFMQWIHTYLSYRKYFVPWNQTDSPSLNLHIDVPQGSILELLFLIYINNIINSSNILAFVLFSDTTVYVQHDSIDGATQILNSEWAKVA